MPITQAFAIAFGLAFAVLGFIYIVWRSTGRDRTASILHALISALFVSMSVGAGTFFLLVRQPNVLIAVGLAIFMYVSAFKTGYMGWFQLRRPQSLSIFTTMFRIHSFGNFVGGCLCGIGSVIYGGPLGVLGVFAALYWSSLHVWMLISVTQAETAGVSKPPFIE